MESELSRLASFSFFPFNSPVSPTDLAKAGFYYEGNRDEVVCYKCSVKHHGWMKGDVPFLIHSSKSPNCPLITGDDSDGSVTRKRRDSIINQLESISISSQSGATGGPVDSQLQTNTNRHRHKQRVTILKPQLVAPDNTTHYTEPSRVVPIDISETTRVREENTQEVVDITSTSTQTTNDNFTEDMSSSPSPYGEQENEQEESSHAMKPLEVKEPLPKYQLFDIFGTRLATFQNWPSHLNQRPEQLAKCGLFYEGNHDYVRCFHCAGSLREWEPEDDPFIEHARWFPFCTFLRQLKGDRFIMDVQSGKITSQLQNTSAVTTTTDDHGFENCMDHPAVLSVMDMGYSEGWMKKAISVLRKHKGKTLTAENLLSVVFDIEENGGYDEVSSRKGLRKEESILQNVTTYKSSSGSICNDIPENDADIFNHAAVLAVRLVGSYTNEQILEAVALLKSNQKDVFNASNLMQCLIDIEDLEEEAKQQKEKTERNMKDAEIEELRLRTKCKVCLEEELKTVFLPCGHLCTCVDCASHLERCPVCREQKRSTVKAYLT